MYVDVSCILHTMMHRDCISVPMREEAIRTSFGVGQSLFEMLQKGATVAYHRKLAPQRHGALEPHAKDKESL
jgi:hypothetical protein